MIAGDGHDNGFWLGSETLALQTASEWISDQLMVSYWAAGVEATEGCLQLSVASDKGRIGGRGKINTAIVLPSNLGFWGVPQAGMAWS